MPLQQRIFALITGFALLFLIFDLIRRRKLKEEYSWIWLATGFLIFLLVVCYPLLFLVSKVIGTLAPANALFLCGFLFLILITLFFSVKLSQISEKVKILAQKIALLEKKKPRKSNKRPRRRSP